MKKDFKLPFILIAFILIFSIQSLTKADDISDFKIEGISIGDSLLDFLSIEEINENIDPNISVNGFLDELEKYDDDILKIYNNAANNGQVLRYIADWNGKKAKVVLKAVNKENMVVFYPTKTIKDTIDGMWVSGLPESVDLIISGQEYISIGEKIN